MSDYLDMNEVNNKLSLIVRKAQEGKTFICINSILSDYSNDIHICSYIRIELPIKTEFISDKILKLSDKLLTKKESTFLIENNKDIWNSIDNKSNYT